MNKCTDLLHIKRTSVKKVLKKRPWGEAQAQEQLEATEAEHPQICRENRSP